MYTKSKLLYEKYTWGKLVEVHEINNYLIVEYENEYEGINSFHPYVNGYDTHCNFSSLDYALIHAIAYNKGHSRASEFIINMLNA